MAENSPRDYFRTKKRYVQVGHLGRGGMAVVSESKDEYFQRNIAYKKLKAGPNSAKRTEEFVREALIMGKLEHPGILPIHELIESSDDTPAITMDKVLGISLAGKILEAKKNPSSWPLNDRIRFFQKLVEIVAYSHSRDIVHRDIKPANVMLEENGGVILLDWGLAKISHVKEGKFAKGWDSKILDSAQSVSGSIKGTPYYMSPEAAQGKSELVKEASDVFGLGAVLYELITLDYLIQGTKAIEVLRNAADGRYRATDYESLQRDMKAEVKKLPKEIEYILNKSLKTNYLQRYKDAGAMNVDLQAFLNGQSISALGGQFSPYQMNKWLRRNFIWMVLIGLPLVGIFYMGSGMRAQQDRSQMDLDQREKELEKKLSDLQKMNLKRDKLVKLIQDLETNLNWQKERLLKSEQDMLKSQDIIAKSKVDLEAQRRELQEIQGKNDIRRFDVDQLKEEIDLLLAQMENLEQSQNQEMQIGIYQNFLKNTVPFGHAITKARLEFESGKRLQAIRSLRDNMLKVDPYVVHWMLKTYGSGVKNGPSVNRILQSKAPAVETLDWWKEGEESSKWENRLSHIFPQKKWVKFIKDKGLRLAFGDDGTVLDLSGQDPVACEAHETLPVQIKRTAQGKYIGHYGDGRFFYMDNLNAKPEVVEAYQDFKDYSLRGPWLVVSGGKAGNVAFKMGSSIMTWPVVDTAIEHWIEKDEMQLESEESTSTDSFPTGYRALNRQLPDGPWLIGFVNVLKSKFRNYMPTTGSKDVLWTLDRFRPIAIHDDGAQGWLMLGMDSRLFSLRPDQIPRQMWPLQSKIIRMYALKTWNLAFAQDESLRCYVYYLNTGQFLFSPGVLDGKIEEIGIDVQKRFLLRLDNGNWIIPGE